MLIIEGIDASGKSTLAKTIARELSLNLIESEGPPKNSNEIVERVERYKRIPNAVFVRHPCVSQKIYGSFRNEAELITPTMEDEFYNGHNLFIYCDPHYPNLDNHVVKDYEDPQHVEWVTNRYEYLLVQYRRWAFQRANIIYRIGDDVVSLVKICATLRSKYL